MQHIPTLRKLPIIVAGLFVASTANSTPRQTELNDGKNIIVASVANDVASEVYTADTESAIPKIEVTAAHLKAARIELSPKTGTTVYTVDQDMIRALGQGDNTPFNEVLLRLPGVDQDSKASGSLHVRDDHGNVQYRLNGVILPEGISGFGQSIDTRLIEKVDFVTGTLPAQYGLRSAGVVDIQTKEGDVVPGGRIGILAGSHQYVEPSAEFYGSQGNFNYYLSGSYLSNNIGIENPLPTASALHDQTKQTKSFGSLSYFIDSSSKVGLLFGTYNGKFQIPANPGQAPSFALSGYSDGTTSSIASAQINENQSEVNRFLVLSYQKSLGDWNFQTSVFHQYSELHFKPDPIGDLIYLGVASGNLRSNTANGLQLDSSYKLNDSHTIRLGLAYIRQATESDNSVGVFPLDATGAPLPDPVTVVDNSGKVGRLASFYVQDEWRISAPLTLNYGLRFDKVSAFIDEQQLSPRLNMAYKLSEDTALHAGYSRYFTPPPQELASQNSINLYANTTNASSVPVSDNVKAERTHYYDVGLSEKFGKNMTVTLDTYYKKVSNLIDEGQFGQALILSPFNYERGYAQGLELSGVYSEAHWGSFLNFTYQKANGENIISGQALFNPTKLSQVTNNYIYLDHDQTYTLSGGAHYHFGDSQISADFLYGSGLRKTPKDPAALPNSAALPQYTTVNTTLTHTWARTPVGSVEGRLALVNMFDKTYLLRDGTGIGVGAPQYGLRRTIYVGMSTSF